MPGLTPARSARRQGLLTTPRLALICSLTALLLPASTHAARRDKVPPSVQVTAPAAGATVAGSTTLSATATDNLAVTQAKWYVDGVEVAWDADGAPWQRSWDSRTVVDGSHQIVAKAADAAGNWGTSAVVSFTVKNTTLDAIKPSSPGSLSSSATSSSLTLSWSAATDNVGVAGYRLYLDNVLRTSSGGTSYTFTNLACATTYALGVEAYDAAGNVSPRATLNATTSACSPPPPPPPSSHVLAAVGDICGDTTCSRGGVTADTVRAIAPERVLGLGDFQYQNAGLAGATFQGGFQAKWSDLSAKLAPTFGATHDTCDGSGSWECYPVSYFNAAGAPEARGKLYDNQWGYSFDIGAWHVLVFNYKSGDTAAVAADLDAHPSQCLLAIDHAPVYGSPSSEHPTNEGAGYKSVLLAHGVDLILNGHQHFYERNVADGITEITNGLGGVGHYTRTSVASSAVAYNDTSYGVVKLSLSDTGWETTFVPNAGATQFTDTASGGCGQAPPPPPPPTSVDPSGQAAPIGDLPGWQQIWADNFPYSVATGAFPAATGGKWSAYLDGWQDTSKHGTYNCTKVCSVHDGLLDMWIHTEAGVHYVAVPYPNVPRGMTYGRYAVRFRADALPHYKTAWLLWPDSETWPRDGEVDFPEGPLDGSFCAYMHHQGATSPSDQDTFCPQATYAGWHTAVVEWTAASVKFYLDGALIGTSTTRIPNTPMHWVLQTETEVSSVVPADATQGHVYVDWAAIWRPV